MLNIFMLVASLIAVLPVHAQTPSNPVSPTQIIRAEKTIAIAKPTHDSAIALRLMEILTVTGWFKDIRVSCKQGVVTLGGLAQSTAQSQWAEQLAHDTDEVVAVINNIAIEPRSWFDMAPAQKETENLAKRTMGFLPYLVTSLVLLALFSALAIGVSRLVRRAAETRMQNVLMIELVTRLASLPVFIIGLYLVLRVCGLTGVAATVVGGTGAIGLVAGFAMQNILANYFAGLMLSLRNPYTTGDVITVAGQTGVVQKLTTRGTILVDFDGNHIIIPNSTIYNNIIVNASSNPKTRIKFSIEIGYNDLVSKARATILAILNSSKGVLKEPEPLVLVSDFLSNSVQIRVYFWIVSAETSGDKLKSVIIEQVKETLQSQGYTLPGAVQQLGFAGGIPQFGSPQVLMRDRQATVNDHAPAAPVEIHSEKQELLREASKGRDLDLGRSLNTPKG